MTDNITDREIIERYMGNDIDVPFTLGFKEALRRQLDRLDEYDAESQRILEYNPVNLPWAPAVGLPLWAPKEALEAYRSNLALRASTLARNEMTDEQRAAFAGDARPS